jgi:hypothetical protein
MTKEELAYALLEDMQARLQSPTNGMANRHSVGESLFSVGAFHSNNGKTVHDLANRINRVGRDAFALLEKWELAEPADDMNGRNGYVVLTDKGKSATERTDFERIRVRGLLREEMLHLRLQGQIYGVLRLTILAPPYSKRSRLWKSKCATPAVTPKRRSEKR